jgi:hypothetical protein
MPNLPPLEASGGYSTDGAKLRGIKAQHARAFARKAKEAPQRQTFLGGLLNNDLRDLSKWHGNRPAHEQKRFLKSVDTLYKAFDTQQKNATNPRPPPAAPAKPVVSAEALERAAQRGLDKLAEEDPLNGPPRTPREVAPPPMVHSASAPTNPIEVFEQRKREALRDNEDPNSLDRWLEGGSVSTATTGTTCVTHISRGLSEVTKTSIASGSICSEPGTMHQAHYRFHRRAIHLGKVNFKDSNNPFEAGNLKDGVPNIGFPDRERMVTTFKREFGSRETNANISKEMYGSVIQGNHHPFIEQFLEGAGPEKRDQFTGMVRSLEYLRLAKDRATSTQMTEDMNLAENQRLFKPSKAKPWFDPSQANISMVPLGTLTQPKKESARPAPPKATAPAVPPSPAVSGLSSLPLSRLSTPMVGGPGLPFASSPPEVETIP